MNHISKTFSYFKKIFPVPLAAMLIPSVVACFLSTPYWEVSFVAGFDYNPFVSVATTFRIMFGDSWQYLWPVILIGALQVIGASVVMSAIDRHFRTGRMSLRSLRRLINNSVFPIAIGVLIISGVSILWRFVLFGLVTLLQTIAEAAMFNTGVVLTLISIIAVGMFVLHVMMITPMLYWAPLMFVYGYGFRDAAAASFKLIAKKRLFIGLILPALVCAGIQLLVGFLQAHASVAYIVGFFVFLATNVYVTVYTMLTFYDVSGLERRDIAPYMTARTEAKTEPKPTAAAQDERENSSKSETSSQPAEKSSVAARTSKPHSRTRRSTSSKAKPNAATIADSPASDKAEKEGGDGV